MNQNFEYHGVQFLLPRVAARSPKDCRGLFSKRETKRMCHVCMLFCNYEGTPHIMKDRSSYIKAICN